MASKATTLQPIKKGDFTVTPFTVHKEYTVTRDELTNRGYSLKHCVYRRGPLPVSSSNTAFTLAPTSSDGSYDAINWRSLRHLYYREPLEEGYDTFEGYDLNRIEKNLYLTASVISTPYFERGESIKPGSVRIDLYDGIFDNYYIFDDGLGNLKSSIFVSDIFNAEDYYLDKNKLILYWNFDNLYTKTKTGFGDNLNLEIRPYSNIFFTNFLSKLTNVGIDKGYYSLIPPYASSLKLNGNSLVHTPQLDEINFDKSKDFTISFYFKCPTSQSNLDYDYNYIISKSGVSRQLHYGIVETYQKNTLVKRRTVSASIDNVDTNVFPYEFIVYNQNSSKKGKVSFRRSDGIKTIELLSTSKINNGNYSNILVTKSGSLLSLLVDGVIQASSQDLTNDVYNDNDLIFGAKNLKFKGGLSGSLDEIRFYEESYNGTKLSVISDPEERYQTAVVGNVFYKQGIISLTSPEPLYHKNIKDDNWKLTYKNTLTIYENEVLCRIKRDELNFTLNPTARQSVRSENLLTEFITGSLTPYITTIGLYTPNLDLVAVGKLSRPLKKRDDVTMNIIVRWDY